MLFVCLIFVVLIYELNLGEKYTLQNWVKKKKKKTLTEGLSIVYSNISCILLLYILIKKVLMEQAEYILYPLPP